MRGGARPPDREDAPYVAVPASKAKMTEPVKHHLTTLGARFGVNVAYVDGVHRSTLLPACTVDVHRISHAGHWMVVDLTWPTRPTLVDCSSGQLKLFGVDRLEGRLEDALKPCLCRNVGSQSSPSPVMRAREKGGRRGASLPPPTGPGAPDALSLFAGQV